MKNQLFNSMNALSRISVIVLAFFLSLTVSSQAMAVSPDFSGNWALNETKSNLGEGGSRASVKMLVKQSGNTMSIERKATGRDGQEMTFTTNYTLDGKATENTLGRGASSSVCKWSADGKSLTISTTRTMERNGQKMEMKSVEVWTMSGDGKALTINTTGSSPRGERKTTLVYDKQ